MFDLFYAKKSFFNVKNIYIIKTIYRIINCINLFLLHFN